MKNLFLLCILSALTLFSFAQSIEFNSQENDLSASFSPIYDGEEIFGYANCVVVDSDGPNAINYELRIYNSKLVLKLTKKFTTFYDISTTVLYSGERFFFKSVGKFNKMAQELHNSKEKIRTQIVRPEHDVQVYFLDEQGNELGQFEKIIEKIKHPDVGELGARPVISILPDEQNGYYLTSRYITFDQNNIVSNINRYGFILERYDSQGNQLWEHHVNSDRGPLNYVKIIGTTEVHTLFQCSQKTKAKKREPSIESFFYQVLDNATGEIVSEFNLPESQNSEDLRFVFLDSDKNEVTLMGRDYKPDERESVNADDILGLYQKTVDFNGTLVSNNQILWKDIISLLSEEEQAAFKSSSAFRLQARNILDNGNYRLILEHYTKGRSSKPKYQDNTLIIEGYFRFRSLDFLEVEVTPEMKIIEVKRFERAEGEGRLNSAKSNYTELNRDLVKLENRAFFTFDLNFITSGKADDYVLFYQENKGEEKGLERNVCYVGEDKNGDFVQGKIKIDSKASEWKVHQATHGYVAILEKFPKENKYVVRIEKIDL